MLRARETPSPLLFLPRILSRYHHHIPRPPSFSCHSVLVSLHFQHKHRGPNKDKMDGRRVGVLGGGQLGRMMAEAGHRLGIQLNILDPGTCGNGEVGGVGGLLMSCVCVCAVCMHMRGCCMSRRQTCSAARCVCAALALGICVLCVLACSR